MRAFKESDFVALEIDLDSEHLHELPADEHLRRARVGGDVEYVERLVFNVEFADGERVDVDGSRFYAAADGAEVDCFSSILRPSCCAKLTLMTLTAPVSKTVR